MALQEEESLLLFLEKMHELQLWLHLTLQRPMLGWRRCCRTRGVQLKSGRCTGSTPGHKFKQRSALWAAVTDPQAALLILIPLVSLWHEELSSGTTPAPVAHLWNSCCGLIRIPAPSCRPECRSCATALACPWSWAGESFPTAWIGLKTSHSNPARFSISTLKLGC